MAKWKSPFLTDIRNKLGESVVFSMWKGRPYMRQHVTPANPNSSAQQAHRADVAQYVERYKSVIKGTDAKTPWDEFALSYQISGFNLFTKLGRKCDIEVEAGESSGEVDVTYKNEVEPGEAAIFVYDQDEDEWTMEVDRGDLDSGEDNEVTLTGLTSGNTVEVFIAYPEVLVEGDTAPQDYQAVCGYHADTDEGDTIKQEVEVP